jgi:M6 family metalloprotease-like protein
MKKRLLTLAFVWLSSFPLFALYLIDYPVTITQPDGTEILCYATGDEYYRRIHDAAGYAMIRDTQGYLVYAELKNDEWVSSGYRVRQADPKKLGLIPNVDISAAKRTAIRQGFLDETPQIPRMNRTKASSAYFNTGTLNNLVVFIRFSDDTEFSTAKSVYENYFNKDEEGVSMYRYYKDISHGMLELPSTFYPVTENNTILSYKDINPRSTYANATESQQASLEHALLKRAIDYVKNQVPASLNLDFNNDGYVDNVCFVIKGDAGAWSSMLWPHRWALYTQNVQINGKRVWDYNFILENHLLTVSNGKQSVLVHETYHTLGAPDLYRYTDSPITPVGIWDVMASNTVPPQSSSAYITWKYGGWISEIPAITTSGTYTLHNVWSETNNCYKIASPNSSSEYFVLEYRDKNVLYESKLPGSGIIIYRVNPAIEDGNASGPPDEVYVFRSGGTPTANGNLNNAYFSAQSGRTSFSDTSSPRCFLSNGNAGLGGIVIDQISNSGGETMTFRVTFPSLAPPVATAATQEGRNGFTANWEPSTNTSGYLLSVYYKQGTEIHYDGGGFEDQPVGNVVSYKVSDLDRAVAMEWYYTLKAVSGNITSVSSNEIGATLELYDPIECVYRDNTGGRPTYLAMWSSGYGYVSGSNIYQDSDYAEYFQLPEITELSGVKMRVGAIENHSGNPEYAKITLMVWDVAPDGMPGNILHSEDKVFSEIVVGDNVFNFAAPVKVPAEFFIGYGLYYDSVNPDVFAVNHTWNSATSTAYVKEEGEWFLLSTWMPYLNLFVFPLTCPFVPEPAFTADKTEGYPGLSVQFANETVADSQTTYLWNFGDETTSAETEPEHTYLSEGNYTVTLTATNHYGANTTTKTNFISVSTPTALPSVSANYKFYPNPAKGQLHVETASPLQVRIYSLEGVLVWSQSGISSTVLDISHLSTGIYILEIMDEKNRVRNHRLIVE